MCWSFAPLTKGKGSTRYLKLPPYVVSLYIKEKKILNTSVYLPKQFVSFLVYINSQETWKKNKYNNIPVS